VSDDNDILKHAHIWTPFGLQSAPDPKRCCAAVHNDYGIGFHQCSNKWKVDRAGHRFCSTHDPVTVKAKQDARSAVWEAKYAESSRLAKLQSDRNIFANACIKAVREIAASHNDPRALAVEILKTDPDAKDGGERE
jgi:hypothetical protein